MKGADRGISGSLNRGRSKRANVVVRFYTLRTERQPAETSTQQTFSV